MKPRASHLNQALAVFLSVLAFAGTGQAADNKTSADKLKAGVFEPPRMAPDFSLRGSDGAELRMSRFRGKVVVLGFGFTHCAYVCPVTLGMLGQARKKLGAAGNDVQVVYITVDPTRDTPERMREYLTHFHPSFLGGTGTEAQLAEVRKGYGITATRQPMKDSPGDYAVDHSSFLYLIDREGTLRGLVPYGRSADDIVHDVKILLKK